MNDLEEFLEWIARQAVRKDELYDGVQNARQLDEVMRFTIEELGEVSSAITRERWELAKAECVDLAHCAFLLYRIIKKR